MTSGIRFTREGRLGIATLDRQSALNALTRRMVQALSLQLAAWKDDPEVGAVLVRAAPGRAFCAGGDIRHAAESARDEGVAEAVPFFRDEYRMNWRIKQFPKPYIAFLDGITMGGGVGISVHGSDRIVTENTMFAMPETGIGFFPDVGGTYFLPRCPGAVGTWLGFTGARLGAADCIEAGIGTAFVPAARLEALAHRLAETGDPGSIAAFAERPEGGTLARHRPQIDRCFAGDSVRAIHDALDSEGDAFAAEQLAALATKSPFAVHVTLAQLRRGRALDFAACMQLEYRLVHRVLVAGDFIEGVRALIIDKDKRPRWRHPGLDEVPAAEVEACFAPLAGGDLPLDWTGL